MDCFKTNEHEKMLQRIKRLRGFAPDCIRRKVVFHFISELPNLFTSDWLAEAQAFHLKCAKVVFHQRVLL